MWLRNYFIHHLMAVEGLEGDDSDDARGLFNIHSQASELYGGKS